MSPRALSATLPKVTRAVLEKGGRDYAALIAEWKLIVGEALAESSLPEKLARKRPATEGNANPAGGVLTVRVTSGAAMEFQHREPQILERINAYLGHRAVDRLKLIPRAAPARSRPSRQRSCRPSTPPSPQSPIRSCASDSHGSAGRWAPAAYAAPRRKNEISQQLERSYPQVTNSP
jgi:hypothetical protein